MNGHRRPDAPDPPAALSKSAAEIGLFSSRHRGLEAAYASKRRDPHHEDPPTGLRLAHGEVPFHVEKPCIDGAVAIPLSEPTTDGGEIGVSTQLRASGLQPGIEQLAIPVDELDVLETRPDFQ